jgi:hypothetical protein
MPRARLKERLLCHYCGVNPGITTDHIVPRAFSGPDAMWNYVSSCEQCNLDKAASWPTCSCSVCQGAIARFLADPAKRERAMERLAGQISEMNDGILAMHERIAKLSGFRSNLVLLHMQISAHREEVFTEVDEGEDVA